MRLRAAHISGDLKKTGHALANIVFGSPTHSRSIGLEGEKQFGSYKKKLNTMIGSLPNSHRLNKLIFFVPQ